METSNIVIYLLGLYADESLILMMDLLYNWSPLGTALNCTISFLQIFEPQ